jgi:hypothetical protein
VKVKAVPAKLADLAEMSKFGIGDRAGRMAVVARVPAVAGRVGRFDDHVAAQISDLAATRAFHGMIEEWRSVEREAHSVEGAERTLLGLWIQPGH